MYVCACIINNGVEQNIYTYIPFMYMYMHIIGLLAYWLLHPVAIASGQGVFALSMEAALIPTPTRYRHILTVNPLTDHYI